MKRVFTIILISFIIASLSGCKPEISPTPVNKYPLYNVDSLGISASYITETKDFTVTNGDIPFISLGLKKELRVYEKNEEIIYYCSADADIPDGYQLVISIENSQFKVNEENIIQLNKLKKGDIIGSSFKEIKNGIYKIEFSVIDASGKYIFNKSKNIGIMQQAKEVANKDFYFAVQPFLIRPLEWAGVTSFDNMTGERTYNITWKYIDYMGANVVRDGAVWASQQPSEDAIDYKFNDRLVDDCEKRGVLLDWTMGGTPAFAAEERFAGQSVLWDKPPKLDYWIDYITDIAKHYSTSKSIIYEIINEPNWQFFRGTPQEYVTLLEKSTQILKAANTNNIVIPGGMVMPTGDKDDNVYYSMFSKLISQKLLDYVAFHSHQDFTAFLTDVVAMKNFTDKYGIDRKKLFLNESGLESSGIGQAEEVMKKAIWAKGNGLKGFTMFSFRSFDGGGADARGGWGAITKMNEPKELYIAYGSMINILNNAIPQEALYNNLYNLYLFEKDGKSIVVHYKDGTMEDASFKYSGNQSYKVYDILGNEISLETANTVTAAPVYIVYDGKVDANQLKIDISEIYKDKAKIAW